MNSQTEDNQKLNCYPQKELQNWHSEIPILKQNSKTWHSEIQMRTNWTPKTSRNSDPRKELQKTSRNSDLHK